MSQRYEYSIALRVHHPSIDPRAISRKLKMRPRIYWRVGEPRASPTDTPMPGIHNDTYWSKTLTPGGVKVPTQKTAETKLTGTVAIWISSYSTTNYSFIFEPTLIQSIHDLGCELIVDVYPYPQNWGV